MKIIKCPFKIVSLSLKAQKAQKFEINYFSCTK